MHEDHPHIKHYVRVGSYLIGSLMVGLGIAILGVDVLASRMDGRYAPKQLLVLAMAGAWWLLLGLAFVVSQAAWSTAPSLPLLIPMGLVVVVWNFVGWPVWWRHLGNPAAWRGEARLSDRESWRKSDG